MERDPNLKQVPVATCRYCGRRFPMAVVETRDGKKGRVPVAPVLVQALKKRASVLALDGRPAQTTADPIPQPGDVYEDVIVLIPHEITCRSKWKAEANTIPPVCASWKIPDEAIEPVNPEAPEGGKEPN